MEYTDSPKENKICQGCGVQFQAKKLQTFCNDRCRNLAYRSKYRCSELVGVASGTVGAIAELMVCADLMKQGYEVFRAMSPASNCDVLAIKGEVIKKYEIRTGQYYQTKNGLNLHYPRARTEGKDVIVVTHHDSKIHYI
jgi:hypothetical protein